MKKSLFALSLALLGNAFAMDLISIATNGAFNENSLGVKTLNDQEMSEVVGGAYIEVDREKERIPHQYGFRDNYGVEISYTAYYILHGDVANELLPLNVDDGSGRYKPVVKATLNHLSNQVSISIIGMNQYNPVYSRPADSYYANKLLSQYKKEITTAVNNRIRGDAKNYWDNKHK